MPRNSTSLSSLSCEKASEVSAFSVIMLCSNTTRSVLSLQPHLCEICIPSFPASSVNNLLCIQYSTLFNRVCSLSTLHFRSLEPQRDQNPNELQSSPFSQHGVVFSLFTFSVFTVKERGKILSAPEGGVILLSGHSKGDYLTMRKEGSGLFGGWKSFPAARVYFLWLRG